MTIERCAECGFDSEEWTDKTAIAAVTDLPARWRRAIEGLDDDLMQRRPIARMWSIGEYTDHVRETTFGMRFILDIAVDDPGTDLGRPPEPRFDDEPRPIDVGAALTAFEHETVALAERLREIPVESWTSTVIIGNNHVDAHWIVRHALHDVTHHLGDIRRLRAALE